MNRARLPHRRRQKSFDLRYAQRHYVVSIGRFEDGRPAEVFISMDRPTSASADIARDGAILISLALQHGVPVATMRRAVTREDDGGPASIIGAALDLLDATDGEPEPTSPDPARPLAPAGDGAAEEIPAC